MIVGEGVGITGVHVGRTLVGVGLGFGVSLGTSVLVFTRQPIFVHPRTPFVQKQLLQKLLSVSSPVHPVWTVSPPVSLHIACVVLGVCGFEADKVAETFA